MLTDISVLHPALTHVLLRYQNISVPLIGPLMGQMLLAVTDHILPAADVRTAAFAISRPSGESLLRKSITARMQ
jgi:hypothetical protein